MQFKDLAEQLAVGCPVDLAGEVVEREGKKGQAIKTFMLVADMKPPRALYRKNLRGDAATFLASEVPPRVLASIRGSIAGL